jgi:hypothetical protein
MPAGPAARAPRRHGSQDDATGPGLALTSVTVREDRVTTVQDGLMSPARRGAGHEGPIKVLVPRLLYPHRPVRRDPRARYHANRFAAVFAG